ncbi:MAG: hypothetical protein WC861_04985 [Candidatus Micrarchaeia archaeon]|jgi:asparagine N-glycosylation enzyme membrane subunit Stt3
MVAFTFDAFYFSLVVFLSAIIPGVALGWPLLKKSGLGVMEQALLCFFIGLFAVPSLLYTESLIGLKFSLFLVFANILILVAAGLFMGVRSGAFSFPAPKLPSFDKTFFTYERASALAVPLLLFLVVILAFWIRIQTFSPMYSELDPYWYIYGTGQIIREGVQPATDDTAWWPEVMANHHAAPLKEYLEAEWFALYTNGGAYNNYLLFTTSSWLPPISAAFVSLGAYFLVSSLYGRRYGLFAAFLLAFLPITIYKMSAGVNEAAPVGNMVLFMSMGLFAMSLVKKNDLIGTLSAFGFPIPIRALGILSAFGFFVSILSSNYTQVIALPLAGFAILQSADYFYRGRKNDAFMECLLYAMGGFILGVALNFPAYSNSVFSALTYTPVLMALAGAAFAIALQYLSGLGWDEKKRYTAIGAGAIAVLLLVFLTPVGAIARGTVSGYLGAAEFTTALSRTISEQNLAGVSFEGEAGFIAVVPKDHVEQNASGFGIMTSAAYGALSVPAAMFTFLGNSFFRLLDMLFGAFAGVNLATSAKADSLFFVFLVIAAIGPILRHFSRSKEGRDLPSVALILLLVTMPVIYIGINKIKYTIFAGMMIAVAAAVALAELERLFRWICDKAKADGAAKYVSAAFACLLVLTVYAQAAGPVPYAYVFTVKSFEPRYQDNPVAMAPVASKLCEDLRARGVPYGQMQSLCDAGAYANFSDDINSQFNIDVCWLSQMRADELFPPANDTAAQKRSAEAVTSAKFRCNRVADYWMDSMEWMNRNLGTSDRVTSWWDYGHWTNFFADRKTVLRNEHASQGMIGRVAHDYIVGSTQDLADSMNYFDSRYALFDVELIGGSTFGGKYGALNYLGCVHEGATSLAEQPGTSDCEFSHSPERIAIPLSQTPANTCTISESQQRTGVYAYLIGKASVDQTRPSYCVGEATLATGEKITATYYVDRKDANGDLALSKGFIRKIDEQNGVAYAEMVYNNQKVWPGANGTVVDGMEDAKTDFYRSNLYKGFYLEDLPGFDLVYTSKNGEIKIYRLKGFVGNKAGWKDPATTGLLQ